MILHTLQGDDAINELAMAAMDATVWQLYQEGVLTKEQAEDWLKTHVCMMVHKSGGLHNWLARLFKKGESAPAALVKVFVAPVIKIPETAAKGVEYDEAHEGSNG